MGYNFPNTPAAGEIFEPPNGGPVWRWNGFSWVQIPPPTTGIAHTDDDQPPLPWADGQLWWRASTGQLFMYYDDGSSAQWIEIGGGGSGGSSDRAAAIVATSPPPMGPEDSGQLWWNPTNNLMSCWVYDSSGRWVPITTGQVTPQMFGAKGDGVTNDTVAFQAAAAAGVDLYIPAGLYVVTDMITIPNGRTWQGAGHTRSRIWARTTFNMAAAGVIKLGTAEPGANLYDVEIVCEQNTAETVRANMRQYPWAIVANVPRCQIDRVRISAAWNGVDMVGNSGGSWIGRIEIGALNIGIKIDGALDFVHGESWHFSPFGFYGTETYTSVYRDGNTIAAQFGKVDGLAVSKLGSFVGRVEMLTGVASSIPRMISILQLDDNSARLIHQASSNTTMIGQFYSTKGTTVAPDIEALGGRLLIGQFNRVGVGTSVVGTPVVLSSGFIKIDGGFLNDGDAARNFLLHTAGTCEIRDCTLAVPGTARTVPYIKATGGQLRVKGCTVETQAGSGPLIEVTTDNYHDISDNNFGAFSFLPPTAASPTILYGRYGPNKVTRVAFTPVLTFATPGDLAYTATAALGSCYWDTYGYRFTIRLVISGAITHTTASGSLRIGGLPAGHKGIDAMSVNVSRWGKIDLTAGYTDVGGSVGANTDYIALTQHGDNLAYAGVAIANLPTGTTGFEVTIDGFIQTI